MNDSEMYRKLLALFQ